MAYVDGFLLALPKSNVERYKAIACECAPIWKEYGALDYVECIGDDTPYGKLTSFPRAVQATEGEVVVFSWIVYPSKAVRDAANEKIMKDERLTKLMDPMPFDGKRMIFGGFKPFLGL